MFPISDKSWSAQLLVFFFRKVEILNMTLNIVILSTDLLHIYICLYCSSLLMFVFSCPMFKYFAPAGWQSLTKKQKDILSLSLYYAANWIRELVSDLTLYISNIVIL